MQFPVTLNFKKIALAKQATLTDSNSNPIAYARQKILSLRRNLKYLRIKQRLKKYVVLKQTKFWILARHIFSPT